MAKSSNKVAASIIVAALLIIGGFWYFTGSHVPTLQQQFQGNTNNQPSNQPSNVQGFSAGTCPTTGQTTATFDLKNGLDVTADTTFDATGYLFGNKGHYVTISDTTAGTATLNCGETYTLKFVSQDADRGDNAHIRSIEQGQGAVLNPDGTVTFTPSSAAYYMKVVSSMHGILNFRIWNVDNGAWRYYLGANVNSFTGTGALYNGTTSENSTVAVGSGGTFTDEIHFKSNDTQTDGADFGYYILVDAATAKWNEPTVRLDGVVLSKSALVGDEARQFSSTYEYAYKVDGRITDSEHVLKVDWKALAGVNPADVDSPTVAIAATGAYKATSSTAVNIAAAKDDSSATKVFTIQTAKELIS